MAASAVTVWRASQPALPLRRPNATRTVAVLTPLRAAIAARLRPCPSRSRIQAATCSVSFDGPFGPVLAGTNPATPALSYPLVHRHSVTMPTSNAGATAAAVAIFVLTSWTAASRRPTSSPAANTNVTRPDTNTTPPCGPSTGPATGPIGTASAGSSRQHRLAHPTHPATPEIRSNLSGNDPTKRAAVTPPTRNSPTIHKERWRPADLHVRSSGTAHSFAKTRPRSSSVSCTTPSNHFN